MRDVALLAVAFVVLHAWVGVTAARHGAREYGWLRRAELRWLQLPEFVSLALAILAAHRWASVSSVSAVLTSASSAALWVVSGAAPIWWARWRGRPSGGPTAGASG